MPDGGVKESGLGRKGIKYVVKEMTELKLVIFRNKYILGRFTMDG